MATNPGQELSSINFGSLIGGPLCAVIEAQTQAARSTADFIKSVGFDPNNNPIYVSFKYPKEVAAYQPAVDAHVTISNPGAGYSTTPPAVTTAGGLTFTATVLDGKVTGINFTGTSTATARSSSRLPRRTPSAPKSPAT